MERIILLTSRENLRRKYGQSGLDYIIDQIYNLKRAHESEGYESLPVFIDTYLEKHMRTPSKIRELLFSQFGAGKMAHILIIGNHDIIPFFSVENLLNPYIDPDRIVYTDMLYGCQENKEEDYFDFLPFISVGRIPDSAPHEPQFLIAQLKQSAEHRTITVNENTRNFFGYYAARFEKHARPVLSEIDHYHTALKSPPVDRKNIHIPTHPVSWFFMLLHGTKLEKYWYGENREGGIYPEAFSPQIASEMTTTKNALGFVLPCYGGYILQKDTTTSCALALKKMATTSLVCSTVLVWAGRDAATGQLLMGPQLAQLFFTSREKCDTIGEYLMKIKQEYIQHIAHNLEKNGKTGCYMALKTLLQFNLYGDPTIKYRFRRN